MITASYIMLRDRRKNGNAFIERRTGIEIDLGSQELAFTIALSS